MLEILVFVLLGVICGIIIGLVPGIHPNMIVLAVPLLASLNIPVLPLLAFVVALGVTNSFVDFIPSVLLGAPEGGNELSVLPGHRLLMDGRGYEAIKLTAMGGLGAAVVVVILFPFLAMIIPVLYGNIRPIIHLLLLSIVLLMILTENGNKKIVAAFVFLLAGSVGLMVDKLPLDSTMVLFPIFSGFFGVSMLIIQLKHKTKIPEQTAKENFFPRKQRNRSVVSGSVAGIFSGFLPGVGSSEIATLATVDRNDRSFLSTMGALTTANIILSILSLWLIGRPRSGLAVAIDQLLPVSLNEVIFVLVVSLISVGIAVIVTLKLAGFVLRKIEKIDCASVSKVVVALVSALTFVFTGVTGLALLVVCVAMGIFVNLSGVKRGNLMAVLILPTMLFYAGF